MQGGEAFALDLAAVATGREAKQADRTPGKDIPARVTSSTLTRLTVVCSPLLVLEVDEVILKLINEEVRLAITITIGVNEGEVGVKRITKMERQVG